MPLNTWSRTKILREPARPMRPVVDPAGWYAEEFRDADHWIYRLSDAEVAELDAAVAGVEQRGLDIKDVGCEDFPLATLAGGLAEIREELMQGRGFVLVRGLPMARYGRAQAAAAFWGVGTYLGEALSQNAKGHLLGHVKDLGMDYTDAQVRGYQTHAGMNFHADQCDILGLACLHPARSGGASALCSSVTLYNEMLKRRFDLARELTWKFYWTRHGEVPPETDPWYRQPVFSFHAGHFTARGVSSHIAKAQNLPGVPGFTAAQKEAMALYKSLAAELAFNVDFQPGDMMFFMNHAVLHARTEFEDWPEPERKRHLLRLWLTTHGIRPLPGEFAQQTVGIRVAGADFRVPLNAE